MVPAFVRYAPPDSLVGFSGVVAGSFDRRCCASHGLRDQLGRRRRVGIIGFGLWWTLQYCQIRTVIDNEEIKSSEARKTVAGKLGHNKNESRSVAIMTSHPDVNGLKAADRERLT